MNKYSAARTERLVKMLCGLWKVRRSGNMGDSALIEYANTIYFICDNGGEWNIDAVNSREIMRSVPYTRYGQELSVTAQAMRVMNHLRGDEQDFLNDADDTEENKSFCEIVGIPSEPEYPPYGSALAYMDAHFSEHT